MKTTQDFINQLNKFTYTGVDTKCIVGDHLGNTIKVSYYTKLASSITEIERMPVQIVARIEINGQHAQTWGMENNEDNALFVKWFVTTQAKAYSIQDKAESVAQKSAKELFNSL